MKAIIKQVQAALAVSPIDWHRVFWSLLGFIFLAWGFGGIYTKPAPSLSEWALFCLLLILILLETAEAGWYQVTPHLCAPLERKPVARESGRQALAKIKEGH